MENLNIFNEVIPSTENIINRMKMIASELKLNFTYDDLTEKSLKKKCISVNEFYKKSNSKMILKDFAKNLKITTENNKDFSGIYVFAKKEESGEFKYMYTGISRTVIERVSSHVNRTDSGTATWAYQMAKYNYEKNKNAKMPKNEVQKKISDIQKDEIANYYVSFIPEPDNFIMHIAEGYVACALGCEWNSFKTH